MNLTVSERTLMVVAAGLVVLILLLLALVVYPSSPPSTNTSSSSAANQSSFVRGEQVLSLVGQFSNALGNRSVQALANLYSSNSTTRWYGDAQGLTDGGPDLAGTYVGRGNIGGLYSSFIARTSSPWVERMTSPTIQVGQDSVNSTSDLSFFGIDESGSVFNSTVGVQQEWVQDSGAGWHIQAETWDFLNFTSLSLPGSPWVAGESYPEDVQGQSCTTLADETYDSGLGVIVVPNVLGGDYVFCVGGTLEGQAGAPMSYFAEVPLSSGSDLGHWTATTPYPAAGVTPSCVAYVQAIFCVGGGAFSSPSSAVYAAPISSHGLGAWENVGSYPLAVSDTSCVLRPTDQAGESPYMVCVGGRQANGTDTDAVYGGALNPGNAQIPSEFSAGPWTALYPPYPIPVEGASCVFSYSIYCIGGMADGSPLSQVFAAGAIVNGEASWSQYASYPVRTSGESCAVGGLKSSIYCLGGEGMSGNWTAVYSTSRLSGAWSSAVWIPAHPYPGELYGGSCFFGNDTITLYCIAGSQVEYSEVLDNNSSP